MLKEGGGIRDNESDIYASQDTKKDRCSGPDTRRADKQTTVIKQSAADTNQNIDAARERIDSIKSADNQRQTILEQYTDTERDPLAKLFFKASKENRQPLSFTLLEFKDTVDKVHKHNLERRSQTNTGFFGRLKAKWRGRKIRPQNERLAQMVNEISRAVKQNPKEIMREIKEHKEKGFRSI